MNYMHKDVLISIIDSQLNRARQGETLSPQEIMELLETLAHWIMVEYREVADNLKEVANLYKDHRETIRIYDLFLANKGLEYEFDKFQHRILRRKFRNNQPKPNHIP